MHNVDPHNLIGQAFVRSTAPARGTGNLTNTAVLQLLHHQGTEMSCKSGSTKIWYGGIRKQEVTESMPY